MKTPDAERNTLHPHFDNNGNLIAFAHQYTDRQVKHLNLHTAKHVVNLEKRNTWEVVNWKKNNLKKIPVIRHTNTDDL